MESNDRAGIVLRQPRTFDERTGVAATCATTLSLTFPVLVDSIQNDVERAYAAFPDRLYLIDRDGKVAYKGGRGPFGYRPRELEQAMALLLAGERLQRF